MIPTQRRPNGPQRRRELCDAAIELLGTGGSRGLSHPKVDQHAGVPPGTTSYYFRTRKALVHGVAEHMRELDTAELNQMTELATDGDGAYTGPTGLAALVVLAGQQPWLTRTRARYELAIEASRDPELADIVNGFDTHFHRLVRTIIAQWQADGTEPDPDLLDQQSFAILRFLEGMLLRFCRGAPSPPDVDPADQITTVDRIIRGILAGMRDDHTR